MGPDEPVAPQDGPVGGGADRPVGDASGAEPGPPPPPPATAQDGLGVDRLGAPHVGATVARAPRGPRTPRGRRAVTALGVLLAVAGGFAAGLVASERPDLTVLLRDRGVLDVEQDAAMVGLLEDVIRTEGVMLAFNDVVAERLSEVRGEEEALAVVSRAAASGAGGLEALRPLIVAREGGPTVEEVRTVYLPHLDSWADYLAAIAEEPALLFTRDDQQPYILLINATAEAFRIALEDLLERGPTAQVAALAERILDDGFRSEGAEPSV